jgi:LPXTG-motif cell wall-anchored protein
LTANANQKVTLTVTINDTLKAKHGQNVTFTVKALVVKTAVVDDDQENEGSYSIKHSTNASLDELKGDDKADEVITYGYKFKKHDLDSGAVLQYAHFVIKQANPGTKYYKLGTDGWTLVETSGGAEDLISDSSGIVTVAGLAKGDYELVETSNPDDYVNPTAANVTPFSVTAGTAADSDRVGEITTLLTFSTDTFDNIGNKHKGTLPSTGGRTLGIMLAISAAIIGFAFFLMKREKDEDDVIE